MKFWKNNFTNLTFQSFLPFLLASGFCAILGVALQPTPTPTSPQSENNSTVSTNELYFRQTSTANLIQIQQYQTATIYQENLTAEAKKPKPTPTLNPNLSPHQLSARGELTYRAAGCDVKGDITLDEPPIYRYYLPEQGYWSASLIEPERGERWFCSEEDAQKNGWLKSWG